MLKINQLLWPTARPILLLFCCPSIVMTYNSSDPPPPPYIPTNIRALLSFSESVETYLGLSESGSLSYAEGFRIMYQP